jgi:cytochrome P450
MTPKTVKALREAFEPPAEDLAAQLVTRECFDGVGDLAQVYPIAVFADALGLPEAGREHLLPYGNLVFNAFGPDNDLRAGAFADARPVVQWITAACQRESLAPGGLGAMIWEAVDNGEITAAQAPLLVRSLLSAGLDTTVYAIGNALWCLANNPDQYALLHSDPSLAKGAFEESLRLESTIQTFFRTTTRPVDIEGVRIPAGEKVLLFLGAANRDPRRWGDDAGHFDIRRRGAGHVAFGHGIHVCVGQFVARLEGEIVLAALAQRAARLELTGDPVPSPNNTLKGYARLPLRVTPAVPATPPGIIQRRS